MNGLPDLTAHDVVQFGARLPKMRCRYASMYQCHGTDRVFVIAVTVVDFEAEQHWDLARVPGAVRLTKSTLAGGAYPLDLAEGIVSEAILASMLRIHWSDIEPMLRRHIVRYEEDVAELQESFDQADPNGFEWQTPDAFVPDLGEAKRLLAEARTLLESLRDLVA